MTDGTGSITNVSEGIYHDFGLNSKFFFNNTSLHFRITIEMICPDLEDSDIKMAVESSEGQCVSFDTSEILKYVELELLNSDEILEVRSNLGVHKAYVQSHYVKLIDSHVSSYGSFFVYRIILVDNEDIFIFTNA